MIRTPQVRAILLLCLALLPQSAGLPAQSPVETATTVLRKHAGSGTYRSLALEQLARAGDTHARSALEKDASQPGASSERPALLSLTALGDSEATRRMGEMMGEDPDLETVRALARSRAEAAGPALVRALRASAQDVRAAAAIAIGRRGYAQGTEALRRALEDEWIEVRAAAASALYRLGDQSMLQLSRARLETPLREVQLAAADAWAPEKPGAWVKEIEPMLRNPAAEVRHAAAERLAKVRRRQVVDALVSDLKQDMPDDTRIDAARVAADLAEPGDVAWLAGALSDPLPEVQILAAGAILRVTRPR